MRITWITRSFLDYRISVFKALDELCGHQLTLIYNADLIPVRCDRKIRAILGERAIGLRNEIRIASRKSSTTQMANVGFSFPIHKDLIKTAKATSPDVMISDGYLKWTYAPLIIKAFHKGIKHIMCYERTPHTERHAGWLRTTYRKLAGRFIDGIDCNGSLTAEYVTKSLGYKKPLTYGHMAADTIGMAQQVKNVPDAEVQSLRERHSLNSLTFIYVGRLIPLKGLLELLKAWKEASLEDASLLLVGEGMQKEELVRYIETHHLTNVKLAGPVDYDNLGVYYKAADCFIIPTLEDNWSLVVPEAMSAGLPVACSIYNGCHPELVKPENGWTFDPLNQQDTVETLRTISTNRDKLPEMGEASKRIVANHTPEHAAQNLFNLCKQLLHEK